MPPENKLPDAAQRVADLLARNGHAGPIVMLPATGKTSAQAAAAALVGPLGKADAAFVRQHTGYSIGGVCPIGHLRETIILVDQDLLRFDSVWAAAGHPHAVFKLTPRELLALTGAQAVDVASRNLA
ncbi:MAG: YbaK/EbsC family protein [Candidatus Accumulibacter propinquus]|jgi:prolyl-tRNA editing enzyme YbaK/EbsC (Cys-tRNA(Pro) deacylase)